MGGGAQTVSSLDSVRYVFHFPRLGTLSLDERVSAAVLARNLMQFASHTSVPIPNMDQPALASSGLAEGRSALCVLHRIPAGEYETEQIGRI